MDYLKKNEFNFEDLRNRFSFDALSTKSFTAIKKLCKKVYKDLYPVAPRRKEEVIDSLQTILLNLNVIYTDNQVLSIYFDKNAWTPKLNSKGNLNKNPGKYGQLYTTNGKFMNYKIFMDLFDKLQKKGFITIVKGYKDIDTKKGNTTKIMNTLKLEALIEGASIHEIFYKKENLPTDYLILRSKKDKKTGFGVNIEFEPTEITKQYQEDLIRFNEYMNDIEVVITTNILSNRNVNDLYQIFCYRVFNEDFSKGGRFYFECQNIKKYKNEITGEIKKPIKSIGRNLKTHKPETNLIELDFKCMHPNLILNEENISCKKTLYDIEYNDKVINREKVKKFLLICFNAESKRSALAALWSSLKNAEDKNGKRIPLYKGEFDIINEHFETYYPKLAENFYKGLGLYLQKKDSDIMSSIMKECVNNLIPMVPYHDSIVVKMKDKEKAIRIMNESYKKITGFDPIIEEVAAGNLEER